MTGKTRADQTGPCSEESSNGSLRIDKWLWQARFFKTRSLAATVVSKGKLRINRMLVSKPHYRVRPGDVLTFPQGHEIRVIRIKALGERRGPAPEARTLYEDVDDPASKECAGPPTGPPKRSPPPAQKREAWGAKGGIDPRRARRQAIDAKMNGR